MLKNAIQLLVQKMELEDRYGHVSCFEAAEAYEKMEKLAAEAMDIASSYKNVTAASLYEVLHDIADDLKNGLLDEDVDLHLYTQDEFIDEYITPHLNDEAVKLFDSLFYFMNSDDRVAWLRNNYIDTDFMYTDAAVNFVIIVD